jgi:hypothetical protein
MGPLPGGKHAVMQKGSRTVHVPNPHGGDIDWSLTKRLLQQADIDRDEWEALG